MVVGSSADARDVRRRVHHTAPRQAASQTRSPATTGAVGGSRPCGHAASTGASTCRSVTCGPRLSTLVPAGAAVRGRRRAPSAPPAGRAPHPAGAPRGPGRPARRTRPHRPPARCRRQHDDEVGGRDDPAVDEPRPRGHAAQPAVPVVAAVRLERQDGHGTRLLRRPEGGRGSPRVRGVGHRGEQPRQPPAQRRQHRHGRGRHDPDQGARQVLPAEPVHPPAAAHGDDSSHGPSWREPSRSSPPPGTPASGSSTGRPGRGQAEGQPHSPGDDDRHPVAGRAGVEDGRAAGPGDDEAGDRPPQQEQGGHPSDQGVAAGRHHREFQVPPPVSRLTTTPSTVSTVARRRRTPPGRW